MKVFNTVPGTHSIQPTVTVIKDMCTLLLESLPCNTEGFVAKQQIRARAREENYGRNPGASTVPLLLYCTFIFLCDLTIWSPWGCTVGLRPVSNPNEPCWWQGRGKEWLLRVPGPLWDFWASQGNSSSISSSFSPLPLSNNVSGESPTDGTFQWLTCIFNVVPQSWGLNTTSCMKHFLFPQVRMRLSCYST